MARAAGYCHRRRIRHIVEALLPAVELYLAEGRACPAQAKVAHATPTSTARGSALGQRLAGLLSAGLRESEALLCVARYCERRGRPDSVRRFFRLGGALLALEVHVGRLFSASAIFFSPQSFWLCPARRAGRSHDAGGRYDLGTVVDAERASS